MSSGGMCRSCIFGVVFLLCFFFFQAEDGIRDGTVTGVQTCALPIFPGRRSALLLGGSRPCAPRKYRAPCELGQEISGSDRKSTRLNSSHSSISYAVFCLKKKKIMILIHCSPSLS